MVMGRPNKGIGHVDGCDGSQLSKQRAKIVLRTINGELSVNEALEKLGIQRAHFSKLRRLLLQGAVDALEPGRPGRPRKHDAESEQRFRELERKSQDLERQLQLERTRVDLAPLLLGRDDGQKGGSATRQERRKRMRERRKRAIS